MKFSERMGVVTPRQVIQIDSIDTPLRNKLWDVVGVYLEEKNYRVAGTYLGDNYVAIWRIFFEQPGDRVPELTQAANDLLRKWFFQAQWYEVYDAMEFIIRNCRPKDGVTKAHVVIGTNEWLEKYLSAYRLVDGHFTRIVDDQEIDAVETALTTPLAGVKAHLSKALQHLSDRANPDAANSIKESISAVESLCSAVVGKRATLGDALNKLQSSGITLHPALVNGWRAIYGYTSNADGIRHAMQDDSTTDVDDALYFLVTCSTFINLLTTRAAQAGITLTPVS